METPSLHLIRAFAAVARHQSFARAARELNMTPSSVSRLVKALEQELGVLLINRTTRSMSLTDAGARYFAECEAAFDQLRNAYEQIRDTHELPRGLLRMSTSLSFGRSHVLPHLPAFMAQYPQIQLDLIMTDRFVDIVAEGVAVAFRIGRLPDSTLVARKLLKNRRILAASPNYLARHGHPADVDDLKRHECIVSTANQDGETWRLTGPDGERSFQPGGRLRLNNGNAVQEICIDGLGIIFHSEVMLAAALRAGRLVRVLPEWSGKETGVYCVFPPRPASLAARAVVDFLSARWEEGVEP